MLLTKYKAEMKIKSERLSNDTMFKTTYLFRICLFTEMPDRLVNIEYSLIQKYRNYVTEIAESLTENPKKLSSVP